MHILSLALAAIKQAYVSKRLFCLVRKNKLVLSLLSSLKELGYIKGFTVCEHTAIVYMRYRRSRLALRGLSFFSRSARRVYLRRINIRGRNILGYYKKSGLILFNTSLSSKLLTSFECFVLGTGGEPLIAIG